MSSIADGADGAIEPASPAAENGSGDAKTLRLLLEWLAESDVACPLCGYNLRGLTAARSPECGTGLQLSVSPIDLPLRPWIALIVALLLPAGFGTLIIIAFAYGVFREGLRLSTWTMPPPGAAWIVSHLVLSVPLSILALAGRRRFLRWPMAIQRSCAIFAWAAIGITILVIIVELWSF